MLLAKSHTVCFYGTLYSKCKLIYYSTNLLFTFSRRLHFKQNVSLQCLCQMRNSIDQNINNGGGGSAASYTLCDAGHTEQPSSRFVDLSVWPIAKSVQFDLCGSGWTGLSCDNSTKSNNNQQPQQQQL